jgi:hypothetical protein
MPPSEAVASREALAKRARLTVALRADTGHPVPARFTWILTVPSLPRMRLSAQVTAIELSESPNTRPGEPHRSWLAPTRVVDHDALAVVSFSGARDALGRLIRDEPLSLEDQVALGRLNSFCFALWYEPAVTMLRDPAIDPEVAAFFGPLLAKL